MSANVRFFRGLPEVTSELTDHLPAAARPGRIEDGLTDVLTNEPYGAIDQGKLGSAVMLTAET